MAQNTTDDKVSVLDQVFLEIGKKATELPPPLAENMENTLVLSQYMALAKQDIELNTSILDNFRQILVQKAEILRTEIELREKKNIKDSVERSKLQLEATEKKFQEIRDKLRARDFSFLQTKKPQEVSAPISKETTCSSSVAAPRSADPVVQDPVLNKGLMNPQFLLHQKPQYTSSIARQLLAAKESEKKPATLPEPRPMLSAHRPTIAVETIKNEFVSTSAHVVTSTGTVIDYSSNRYREEQIQTAPRTIGTEEAVKVNRNLFASGGSSLDGSVLHTSESPALYSTQRGMCAFSPIRPVAAPNFDETTDSDFESELNRGIDLGESLESAPDSQTTRENQRPTYSSDYGRNYLLEEVAKPVPIRPLAGYAGNTDSVTSSSSKLPPRPLYSSSLAADYYKK